VKDFSRQPKPNHAHANRFAHSPPSSFVILRSRKRRRASRLL
jgi:hypothetical protein